MIAPATPLVPSLLDIDAAETLAARQRSAQAQAAHKAMESPAGWGLGWAAPSVLLAPQFAPPTPLERAERQIEELRSENVRLAIHCERMSTTIRLVSAALGVDIPRSNVVGTLPYNYVQQPIGG